MQGITCVLQVCARGFGVFSRAWGFLGSQGFSFFGGGGDLGLHDTPAACLHYTNPQKQSHTHDTPLLATPPLPLLHIPHGVHATPLRLPDSSFPTATPGTKVRRTRC